MRKQSLKKFLLFPRLKNLVLICTTVVVYTVYWHVIATAFVTPTYKQQVSVVHPNDKNEKFTVLTQVYSHAADVQNFIDRVSGLENVERVIVYWNSPEQPLDSEEIISSVPIHILSGPKNSMNNRFADSKLINTEAVFLLDDDLKVEPKDIAYAFQVWQSHRNQIVGFLPRTFEGSGEKTKYRLVGSDGIYSIVLIGASFFNRRYLKIYHGDDMQPMRDYVDSVFNCDDILMNFIVATHSGLPPVQVSAEVVSFMDVSTKGLSEQGDWYKKRNGCLVDLSKLFGRNPLHFNDIAYRKPEQVYRIDRYGVAPVISVTGIKNYFFEDEDAYLENELEDETLTLSITTFARPENVEKIVHMILKKYHIIREVIIWNNNVDNPFKTSMGREYPGVSIRVINSKRNIHDNGRFEACAMGRSNACYTQDDDFIPNSVAALWTSYKLEPGVPHVVSDTGTYNLNYKWTFFREDVGMHAGFAWVGVGAVFGRDLAQRFLKQQQELGFSEEQQRLSCVYFTLFCNEVPITLNRGYSLNQTGLSVEGAFSCGNCTINRQRIEGHKISAVTTLYTHIKDNSVVFPATHHSRSISKRLVKAPCHDDRCVFLASVDPMAEWSEGQKFDERDFGASFASGYLSDELSFRQSINFFGAVDNDLTLFWLFRKRKDNDYFGLRFVKRETISGFELIVPDENRSEPVPVPTLRITTFSSNSAWVTPKIRHTKTPLAGNLCKIAIELVSGWTQIREVRFSFENQPHQTTQIHELIPVYWTADKLDMEDQLFVSAEIPILNSEGELIGGSLMYDRLFTLARALEPYERSVSLLFTGKEVGLAKEIDWKKHNVLFLLPERPAGFTTTPILPIVISAVQILDWFDKNIYRYKVIHVDVVNNPMHFAVMKRSQADTAYRGAQFVVHMGTLLKERLSREGKFVSSETDLVVSNMEVELIKRADVVVFSTLHELHFVRKLCNISDSTRESIAILPPIGSPSLSGTKKQPSFTSPEIPSTFSFVFVESLVTRKDHVRRLCIALRLLETEAQSLDTADWTIHYFGSQFQNILGVECGLSAEMQSHITTSMVSVVEFCRANAGIVLVSSFGCEDPLSVNRIVDEGLPALIASSYAGIVSAKNSLSIYPESIRGLVDAAKEVLTSRRSLTEYIPAPVLLRAARETKWHSYTSVLKSLSGPRYFPGAADQPHITICIATYSRSDLLAETLESVRKLDYPNYDVLIVDDGSYRKVDIAMLDNLSREATKKIRVIKRPRSGAAASRNILWREATNDYLFFLDDDDLLKPNTLTKMMLSLQATNSDAVAGWIRKFKVNPDTKERMELHYWCSVGLDYSSPTLSNTVGGANALFRRSAIAHVGGFPAADFGTAYLDLAMWQRLRENGLKVTTIPAELYYYRENKKGVFLNSISQMRDRELVAAEIVQRQPKDSREFLFGG
ncbi:hypothetical protein SARC_11299 [Sphaeroforma arctica JP610]|uniref:Glycosyltransferase 2-like domain-containing protein n=1 Tax=Sphaeroforma arctica JP610 TaxID=667725 RepID=A0A0L0FIA3_9EUKA|nr:hypothetical protein SARC_11299 [Sphaeroforma arctica JP610]KNC76191.1 hypothetical protein SARC_11299 [Sphaeroforma arctica JP610]|eukprot:XP_014150093.1 hypothetical protein SARC_11299 [Sphaeroforma arctica JP610]